MSPKPSLKPGLQREPTGNSSFFTGGKHLAFSLGSGAVFKIRYLKFIGSLDEEVTTEDVSTSVDMHAEG